MAPEHDEALVADAEHEAAGEAVAVDEAVEDDRRLADRVTLVREPGAHRDQGLEVGAALAQLALGESEEQRGREREDPQRRHADGGDLERVLPARDVDGREQAGHLRLHEPDEEQRVPRGDEEPGPVRDQEGDGDQLEVEQEPKRVVAPPVA